MLRVDEGRFHLVAHTQHLVAHQVDVLARCSVMALGQHLHAAHLHVDGGGVAFVVADREGAALVGLHQLVLVFGNDAHGNGILDDELLVGAHEEVGIGTYPLLPCTGLNTLVHVELIAGHPTAVVGGGQRESEGLFTVSLRHGAGVVTNACGGTDERGAIVGRGRGAADTRQCHAEGALKGGRVGVTQFRAGLDVAAAAAAWRVAQDINQLRIVGSHGVGAFGLGRGRHHVAAHDLSV